MPESGESRPQRPSPPPPNKSKPQSDGKRIWDWSFLPQFLLTTLVVTIGWGLAQIYLQHHSDQQLARDQHQSDQQLARDQHQSDQRRALDQQRAIILQTYINNMRDLLLNHNHMKSSSRNEIRQLATVQTLTTIRSLDAVRNKIVFQFLQDGHFIGSQDALIDLSNADLNNDNLSNANLNGIDLNGATLTYARLNGANLSGATLYGANLGNADLSNANMRNAFLLHARLNGADLSGATLNDATLTGAFLGGTNMNRAALTGARLNGAILTGAHLNDAYLSGANLYGANLADANLSGADLSDANLITSGLTPQQHGLTQQQLNTVKSCTSATLSTQLTCHHNVTINLTYWYTENPAETPVIKNLIGQFEQQYKKYKIHINAVNTNYFQTETAFSNAAQQDNAPDVLRSDVGWVAQFASEGYLLNIQPYISQRDNLSDYLSAPLGYNYYQGHLYGLPQVTDFLALLYNKMELKRAVGTTSPPSTMRDFEKDAEEVVHKLPATYGFETAGTGYNVLPFLYAFGGGMFDQHNNILVKSKGSVNGLEFLLKLENIDKVTPANVNFSNGPVTDIVNDFRVGKTAMIFGGPYDIPEILTGSSFKNSTGNLGIARIPACYAGIPTCHPGQTGSPSGGQSYVISAGTPHPIEAYKFISFMSSPQSQIQIAKANHTLPTRNSAYKNRDVSTNPVIHAFCTITSTVVARPATPQTGHLFDAFDPNVAATLDDVESPIAALSAVADAWNQFPIGSTLPSNTNQGSIGSMIRTKGPSCTPTRHPN